MRLLRVWSTLCMLDIGEEGMVKPIRAIGTLLGLRLKDLLGPVTRVKKKKKY